jgi:2-polyprenyl-3-methyl-5-hydroxy-6-metoxy-1,4-benzoquinol methylase
VSEWRLFPAGTVPEYTTAGWYAGRERAPHLEDETHRPRLIRSATQVGQLAFQLGARSVVDLGAGDGGLLSLLGPALRAWGYDLMPENVAAAKGRGVDVRQGDVLLDPLEWGEIAVATEMLEHLVEPHQFVRTIAANARALVCSSPHNERPGHAYEFHTWAWDFAGYRALVEQGGFTVQHHEAVGPFQVIAAVRP